MVISDKNTYSVNGNKLLMGQLANPCRAVKITEFTVKVILICWCPSINDYLSTTSVSALEYARSVWTDRRWQAA